MTKEQIEYQLKRLKKRMQFCLHPTNAATTRMRTVLKIEKEIESLENELNHFGIPVVNGKEDPFAIEIV